jgi:ornithine cyclodeaminase
MTRSATPLFEGDLLEPGQHLNAAGVNVLDRREIDLRTIIRSAVVAVDSVETAKLESGDLLPAIEAGLLHWQHLAELGDILVGRRPGRTSDSDITLFKSHGMGLQDLYAARFVLDAANERGLGADMPG